MKSTGKGKAKSGEEIRKKDRQSGSGVSGSPKKGGHGGKFTWSGDGYSRAELGTSQFIVAVDSKDPNFEDPDVVVVNN